jgi:hypothetical protein
MRREAATTSIAAMKLAPLLPFAAVLALAAPASAATLGPVDYKIVKATHKSTTTRSDDDYQGRSTASWSLSRPSTFRMNWMAGGLFSGSGRVNVRGSYALDVTTSWPGRCNWTSPTGDREHPLTAPAPFDLTVTPDARRPGMALVGFLAARAVLGNAYTGTECANRVSEPQPEQTSAIDLAPSKLRGKTITLRFAGTRTVEDLTATWSTVIVLERVRAHR